MVSKLPFWTNTKGTHWIVAIQSAPCHTWCSQGAIHSPLLFCIYTNDRPSITQVCDLNSFVDDLKLSLSFPIKDVADARRNLKDDLRHVVAWCSKNELLINPEKTKFFLVGKCHSLSASPKI